MQHLVIAIDVGIKNLALCAWDFVSQQVIHWDVVSLVPSGRYQPAQNVQYVRDFVSKHQWLFNAAGVVVVERQMRCNMRIIEAVLQSLFYDRCVVINPRCVKRHYDLSTPTYRANKAKAVDWVCDFVSNHTSVFASQPLQKWKGKGKLDDLADALIMLFYYLDTYSNKLA